MKPRGAALSLVENMGRRGIALRLSPDGKIRYRPKSAVSPEDVEGLRANKNAICKLLELSQNTQPSPPSPSSPHNDNPDTYADCGGDDYGDDYGDGTPTTVTITDLDRTRREKADKLGLVARWSYVFGYISIHDPTTGEWCDVPTKEAPYWAKRECFKRRELRKTGGITQLLTQAEMEQVWEEEQAEMWEGTEPAVDERGIVYEDYIEEEERGG